MLHKIAFILFVVLSHFEIYSQMKYNDCSNAADICPNKTMSFTNVGANSTQCTSCEDDFNYCFTPNRTIWLKFKTNSSGGTVQLNFSSMVFSNKIGQSKGIQATLIEAGTPCISSTYTKVGNCVSNSTSNFSLGASSLKPNTLYYVVIGGDKSGSSSAEASECTFNLYLTGGAVSRPSPYISILPSSTSICKNDIVTFNTTLINCPDSSFYKWYINGTLKAISAEPYYQSSFLNDGDIVSVKIGCYSFCSDTVSKNSFPVNVTSINVNAGIDMPTRPGVGVLISGTTDAPIHYWTPNLNLIDSLALSTLASPYTTTTYVLTAEKNGCIAYDQMVVNVSEDLVIPTTFTPNGDGINDTFEILYIEKYQNNSLKILDRWGQVIYETIAYDYDKAWDGKKRNGEYAEGVYFYHLELNDEKHSVINGSITILK